MAKVYLDAGDNFALSGAASVYGSTGTEKVTINTGVTGVVVDANVERVDLSGASSTYTFQQAGNQLKVFSGTTLVATIPLQDDANGTQVVFSNGSVEAKVGATGLTLGGAVVPSAAAAAVTPTTIDATVTTGSGVATGGTVTGQAFNLTGSTVGDVPTLTTGNDTITGATGFLATGDVLADPSATDVDTLNAMITGAAANNKPVVSNVEAINLDFKGFGVVYDAASTTNGTITVSTTQDGNTSATLNNVGSTTKIAVGAGVQTLNLASSATTLNLTGGQSFTLNNNATAGTLAFASNGASANTITYDAATGSKALSISGSQSLTIKTADLTDFAGNTVTSTLSGSATSTLEITVGSTVAATTNLSKVAVSSFNINASAGFTAAETLQFASGANVKLSKDATTGSVAETLTLATDGTADALNLTVAASQAGTAGLSLTNFETVNLAVTTSTPASIALLTLSNANANQVVVTGSVNTTITTFTGATTSSTLDASALNGVLTVTIGTNAATVVGGVGADVITGGVAADLIVGGAGNDTINAGVTAGATVNDTIVGGAGNDTITWVTGAVDAGAFGTAALVNGGDGTDTFILNTTVASTLTGKLISVENVTVSATAAAGVGAVTYVTADSDITAGTTQVFTFNGGTGASVLTYNAAAETNASVNLYVTDSAAHVLTGGALADIIVLAGSTIGSTLTGGKGVDNITLSGGSSTLVFAAGDSGITAATADVVVGANTGEILKFTSVTAAAESSALATGTQLGTGWTVSTAGLATKTNATLDDFITAAAASAKAGVGGINGQAIAFTSGGDTYVFYGDTDTSSNAGDGLVKLSGVVITDLAATYSAGSFTLA